MSSRKLLLCSTLAAVIGFTSAIGQAADTPSSADTRKDNTQTYANTASTAPAMNNAERQAAGVPDTVPSGKRHRKHTKRGTSAENADANKTIHADDVTPAVKQ